MSFYGFPGVFGILLVGLWLLYPAGNAIAEALPDHDNGPLTAIFGFPESTEGSKITAHGKHAWDASLIIASHSIEEARGVEELRLDGETTRLAFTYRYGLADKLDISIEAPYVWHQSGSLDSIIDGWHDVFGLPDGERRMQAQDQLEIFYSDSQASPVNVTQNVAGIGDIRLLLGWVLSEQEGRSTALRLGVKLPTGESDTLLGSGGTDFSLGLAGDVAGLWGKSSLSGFYRANITYLGEPDLLADRYNDLVGQLSFGLGLSVHENVDLSAQSRIRSAVYDSDIENLGDVSAALTFGAMFKVSKDYRLVLSVGEDIKAGSAPDVSFQIALRYATSN
jgi:hypothetical protein